mmetsp:Transcript_31215/g.87540  ORF Transcript_31215/g.87540 Transcript_31215/m.87540 type:complete len:344 (+) Transcript_31215:168-1199(+)
MAETKGELPLVCVTGATGYIASHVVRILLERKTFRVRGTVRDLSNDARNGHLRALPGASERLELVQADLLDDASLRAAMVGVKICIHTASPFFNVTTDPEKDLLRPAVEGTKSTLAGCLASGVEKVVLTSSTASMIYAARSGEHVLTESDWSDEAFMRERKLWYPLSKTLAERAAWAFVEEQKQCFSLTVMNPCLVCGPMLQPSMNTSSDVLLQHLDGRVQYIREGGFLWVDVTDVAEAHVLAAEQEEATGRYLLLGDVTPWADFVGAVVSCKEVLPEAVRAKIPREVAPKELVDPNDRYSIKKKFCFDTTRAKELGVSFTPIPDSIRNHVRCPPFQKHLAAV